MSEARKLLGRSAGFSVMTALSRVLGLIRDILLAIVFGVTAWMDAFLIAFKIPNFFRRLTAEGVFNNVYIPVLAKVHADEDPAQTRHFIASSYGVFGLIQLSVALLIWLLAPVIVMLIAPGTLANEVQYQLTVDLLRLTAPYLFFVSLASMLAALLNYQRQFWLPASLPLILNACLISAVVYGASFHEMHIKVVAFSVSLAGAIQVIVLAPAIARLGYLIRPSLARIHASIMTVLKLAGPVIIASAIVQISLLLDIFVASLLQTGSITWLYYADRLIELPLGIFAIAVATVISPELSRLMAQKNTLAAEQDPHAAFVQRSLTQRYQHTLAWAVRMCLLLALPSAVALIIGGEFIIATLFEHGQFSSFDTQMTHWGVCAYALGLPAFMLSKPLVTSFFAHQDTRTPLRIAAIAISVTIVGHLTVLMARFYLGLEMGLHLFLALSTSLGAWVQVVLLWRACRQRSWLRFDLPASEPTRSMLVTEVDFSTSAAETVVERSHLEWHEGQSKQEKPNRPSHRFLSELLTIFLATAVMAGFVGAVVLFAAGLPFGLSKILALLLMVIGGAGTYFAALYLAKFRWLS